MSSLIRGKVFRSLLGITMFGLAFPTASPARAAECSSIQGQGSGYKRDTATHRAQSVVDRQRAGLGRGGVFGRQVQCVESRRRYRTYYSCVVKVRFCSLAGVRPRARVFR